MTRRKLVNNLFFLKNENELHYSNAFYTEILLFLFSFFFLKKKYPCLMRFHISATHKMPDLHKLPYNAGNESFLEHRGGPKR